MKIEVSPLTSTLGAELRGLDLAAPLSEDARAEVHDLLRTYQVLFVREQGLEPAQLLALAKNFGKPDAHAFGPHLEGLPEVICLDQSEPERDGANRWHTDSTFLERPPMAGVLSAVQLPKVGSDTCWASMTAAYDRLSPALQRAFSELTATHDITGVLRRAIENGQSIGSFDEIRASRPPRSHPVVCRHPETGRKFIYVNSNFTTHIDGVSEAESNAMLDFLFEWVRNPEIQVRYRWEVGSVAIWDNRCTQHFAVADYRERRVMHRVSVAGDWVPSA